MTAFEKTVRRAVRRLPKTVRDRLENVDICVQDDPTAAQRRMGGARRGDFLLGLYEGVPLSERGSWYGPNLPDKITLFQNAIEGFSASSGEGVEKVIQQTVWHEIAHHLGFDEEEVRDMEGMDCDCEDHED